MAPALPTEAPIEPRARDPQPTRDACLRAALELLAEVGPERLSLRQVARRADLSAMAPYRHFDAKEALLAELARQGFEDLGTRVRAGCGRGVHLITAADFRTMTERYVEFAARRPALYRLMFSGVIPDHRAHAALWQVSRWSFEIVVQAIEVLQEAGHFRAGRSLDLAFHCWSVMHGFVSLALDDLLPARDGASLVERFSPHIDLMLTGLER